MVVVARMYNITTTIMMQRIRPPQASGTRIKHSMEDGPYFPRCRKVLLYSYRVDVIYL